MTFLEKLEQQIQKNNSLLSVGLDPDVTKIPQHILQKPDPLFEFNKAIIDATHDTVCAYKPQIAHYAADGLKGITSLLRTIEYLTSNHPEIPIILDAKRGDIGSTSELYAKEAFDVFNADAVTVNPYLGEDALEPFLKRSDKGIVILCRTSNKSAVDFQDIDVQGEPLYIRVAQKITDWHTIYGNCLMVVGATWPEEIKQIRRIAKDMFFLVPGIGAQGGDLQATLQNGLREDKSGLIIHSSRSILYASNQKDFSDKAREEAIKLKDQINTYRNG